MSHNDVFISYSRKDKRFVRAIYRILNNTNLAPHPEYASKRTTSKRNSNRPLKVWLDQHDIEFGSEWEHRIKKGIIESNSVAIFISNSFMASEACHNELTYALANNKKIIPIIVPVSNQNQSKVNSQIFNGLINDPSLRERAATHWEYIRSLNWLNPNPIQDPWSVDRIVSVIVATIWQDLGHTDRHTELSQRAFNWIESGRKRKHLLSGSLVKDAVLTVNTGVHTQPFVTREQVEFVQASKKARSRRRLLGALFLAVLIIIASGAFAFYRSSERNSAIAERNARDVRSRELAEDAQEALDIGNLDLGLGLAREAITYFEDPSIEVQSTYYQAAFAPGTQFLMDGHQDTISALAISPDGRVAASVSEKAAGELILWDIITGQQLSQFVPNGEQSLLDVTFSANSNQVLVVDFDGNLIFLDTQTGTELRRIIDPNPQADIILADVSPDGNTILTGVLVSGSDYLVRLLDWETGATLHTLEEPTRVLEQIAYSPNGALVASVGWNKEAFIWNAQTGALIRQLEGLPEDERILRMISFNADNSLIAVASDSGAFVWDMNTTSPPVFIATDNILEVVTFAGDAHTLVVGDVLGKISLWRLVENEGTETIERPTEPVRVYLGHEDRITDIAVTSDGRSFLSSSSDTTLRLWYLEASNEHWHIDFGDFVYDIVVSPDNQVAYLALGDGTIRIVDVATGEERRLLNGHVDRVTSLALSPDGETLLSGSLDTQVIVWDTSMGGIVRRIDTPSGWVMSLSISNDGNTALVASRSGESGIEAAIDVNLIDLSTGNVLFSRADGGTYSTGAHPSRNQFIYPVTEFGRSDSGLYLIGNDNVNAGSTWFTNTPSIIWSLAYSRNSELLAAGGDNGLIVLLNASTGDTIRVLEGHSQHVNNITFSPNGQLLASAGSDNLVILWDVASGQKLHEFTSHTDRVWGLTFSPDGQYLLSASRDGTANAWRIFDSFEAMDAWVLQNRYISEFTCTQRDQYDIEPRC